MRTWVAVMVLVMATSSTASAQTRICISASASCYNYPEGVLSGYMGPGFHGTYWNGQLTEGSAFGETFVAPDDPKLDAVNFLLWWPFGYNLETGETAAFRMFVTSWTYDSDTQGRTTGLLWESEPITPSSDLVAGFPNVTLIPHNTYAVFLAPDEPSSPADFSGVLYGNPWAEIDTYQLGRPYVDGGMITTGFAGGEDLANKQWNVDLDYFDATTLLYFSPVPEPLTLTLLGTGLAGLAALRRRRQVKG